MGFSREAKSSKVAADARRAAEEGHRVFVAQLRGSVGHSPALSRSITEVAEMIEAIEDQGWLMDQFTSVPYRGNMTTVCLFRRARAQRPNGYQQESYQRPNGHRQQDVYQNGYRQQERRPR